MTEQKTKLQESEERKLDPSLKLDRILPKIHFGPKASLLVDPIPRMCEVPTHPSRQASYQLGKGILDYLNIPFSEIDGRVEASPFFMYLARCQDQYSLVCPIYFDFTYPAPKGFDKAQWKEITENLEGISCGVYASGDIFSIYHSAKIVDKTLPEKLIPGPVYGLDRLTPIQLIHSWCAGKIPGNSLIFPGQVSSKEPILELTEVQKRWREQFNKTNQNGQAVLDLYQQGLKTSQPKLVNVVQGKLKRLRASPPDVETAELSRIQEYKDQIKRYASLETQVRNFTP